VKIIELRLNYSDFGGVPTIPRNQSIYAYRCAEITYRGYCSANPLFGEPARIVGQLEIERASARICRSRPSGPPSV
jgi:hypothetical protein